MRVLLIFPPSVATDRSVGFVSVGQPLGVCYLAAAAREAGHEVEILDALEEGFVLPGEEEATRAGLQRVSNGFVRRALLGPPFAPGSFTVGLTIEEVLKRVEAVRPQVVGVSAIFTSVALASLEILRGIKRIDPGITTVIGGAHPTILPEQTLRERCVDYLVWGKERERSPGFWVPSSEGSAGPTFQESVTSMATVPC